MSLNALPSVNKKYAIMNTGRERYLIKFLSPTTRVSNNTFSHYLYGEEYNPVSIHTYIPNAVSIKTDIQHHVFVFQEIHPTDQNTSAGINKIADTIVQTLSSMKYCVTAVKIPAEDSCRQILGTCTNIRDKYLLDEKSTNSVVCGIVFVSASLPTMWSVNEVRLLVGMACGIPLPTLTFVTTHAQGDKLRLLAATESGLRVICIEGPNKPAKIVIDECLENFMPIGTSTHMRNRLDLNGKIDTSSSLTETMDIVFAESILPPPNVVNISTGSGKTFGILLSFERRPVNTSSGSITSASTIFALILTPSSEIGISQPMNEHVLALSHRALIYSIYSRLYKNMNIQTQRPIILSPTTTIADIELYIWVNAATLTVIMFCQKAIIASLRIPVGDTIFGQISWTCQPPCTRPKIQSFVESAQTSYPHHIESTPKRIAAAQQKGMNYSAFADLPSIGNAASINFPMANDSGSSSSYSFIASKELPPEVINPMLFIGSYTAGIFIPRTQIGRQKGSIEICIGVNIYRVNGKSTQSRMDFQIQQRR